MSVHLPTRRKSLRAINRSNCVEPHAGLWLDRFITEQGRENKEARRNPDADVAKILTPYMLMKRDHREILCTSTCSRLIIAITTPEKQTTRRISFLPRIGTIRIRCIFFRQREST